MPLEAPRVMRRMANSRQRHVDGVHPGVDVNLISCSVMGSVILRDWHRSVDQSVEYEHDEETVSEPSVLMCSGPA